jgi:hypothetical protein
MSETAQACKTIVRISVSHDYGYQTQFQYAFRAAAGQGLPLSGSIDLLQDILRGTVY